MCRKDPDFKLGFNDELLFMLKLSLISLLLILTLRPACFSQDNCIYQITASERLHEPSESTQTGFIVKGTRGIYTALHGVVDAKRIEGASQAANEAFSALQISAADPDNDVALLDSPELNDKKSAGTAVIRALGQF